jgi:myo-inositol-1(or 4)-monophosphatase
VPRRKDLQRIGEALERARIALQPFTPGRIEHRAKQAGDPVTAADLAVNAVLERSLPRDGEGWFSEETADDPSRLKRERVWVVDPIDGTKEFVLGVPEWCISIGLVEGGRPVAGGICIPATGQVVLGSAETGVTLDGRPCHVRDVRRLEDAEILASRSECKRGEWDRFRDAPFRIKPTGSVAFKLALVASGQADATWTLVPKHEWDVAAGVALVNAAGGVTWLPGGGAPRFNRSDPRLPGLLATPAGLERPVRRFLAETLEAPAG